MYVVINNPMPPLRSTFYCNEIKKLDLGIIEDGMVKYILDYLV